MVGCIILFNPLNAKKLSKHWESSVEPNIINFDSGKLVSS